jgi:hypothetical protein
VLKTESRKPAFVAMPHRARIICTEMLLVPPQDRTLLSRLATAQQSTERSILGGKAKPVPDIASTTASEALARIVELVTFHNPENGFCVLRVKARGLRDLITVVGHAAMVSPGEFVQMSGVWVNDRTHGQQFRAASSRPARRRRSRVSRGIWPQG